MFIDVVGFYGIKFKMTIMNVVFQRITIFLHKIKIIFYAYTVSHIFTRIQIYIYIFFLSYSARNMCHNN